MQFPDDANGDLLKEVQAAGLDLSQPREIDFFHLFDAEQPAAAMVEAVRSSVPAVGIVVEEQPKRGEWQICTTVVMVPNYDNVTGMERQLDAIAKRFGGRGDGWGARQE
jgi:hypothetical protein